MWILIFFVFWAITKYIINKILYSLCIRKGGGVNYVIMHLNSLNWVDENYLYLEGGGNIFDWCGGLQVLLTIPENLICACFLNGMEI